MKIKALKDYIAGERVSDIELEFEGVRYEVQDMYIAPTTGKSTVVLRFDRFDEIDESGITGDDLI